MTRKRSLTIYDLPLYAADDLIGEAVLGFERRREFTGLATVCEPEGMPKISEFWGARYVPAVKAFLDSRNGLGARPMVGAPHGKEDPEGWHRPAKKVGETSLRRSGSSRRGHDSKALSK